MAYQDDDVPPLHPGKVALFVGLLGLIAFAGWRFWRAQQAVAAVAEASKDYRRLFPARNAEPPPPPVRPVIASQAPVSGIGMLKIDDDMRAPRPAPAAEPPPPEQEEAPPEVSVKAEAVAAAPVKPAKKAFNQPRLNSGAFSTLNGGSGVGFSGGALSGAGAAPAAPVLPAIPGLPPAEKK